MQEGGLGCGLGTNGQRPPDLSVGEARGVLCSQASNIQPEGNAGGLAPSRTLSLGYEGSSQQLFPRNSCARCSQVMWGLQDISPAPAYVTI